MKDENNSAIMKLELKAKMYACRMKKTKSVKSNVAKSITFENYMRCLNDTIEMTCRQLCRLRSKLHEVYMISETKIALSSHDDK